MSELPLTTVSARGSVWFDRLQSILGQFSPREYIAIDIVSGDWAVARSTSLAMREMHRRDPNTQLFLRRIGNEPEPELAALLFIFNGGDR